MEKQTYKYRRLKCLIKIKFGTQTIFAKEIGFSNNYVSNKLTCKTQFSQADIELWASVLDIEKSDYGVCFFT